MHLAQKQDEPKPRLACNFCSQENTLDPNYLLVLDQLLQQKDETIFKNFPPDLSNDIALQLNHLNIQYSNKDALIDQVNNEFNQFKTAFLSCFQGLQKQLIAHINQTEDQRRSVIKSYNKISWKKELYNKINEYFNNPEKSEELNIYLNKYIQDKKESFEKDKKEIQYQLQNYNNLVQKIDLNHIQNSLTAIQEQIQSTNIFKLSDEEIKQYFYQLAQLQSPYSTSEKQPPSSPLIEEKLNIKSISQLDSIKNISLHQDINVHCCNQSLNDDHMLLLSLALEQSKWVTQLQLNLRGNKISDLGVVSLCKPLIQMTQLTKLELDLGHNNNIGQDGINQLSQSLFGCKFHNNLRHISLNFYFNQNITDDILLKSQLISVLSFFTELSTLELNLNSTNITGNSVRQIANALNLFTNLKILKLDLSEIKIIEDDDCFVLLGRNIQHQKLSLTELQLNLQNNKIKDESALSVINSLLNCSYLLLQSLNIYLEYNKISKQSQTDLKEIQKRFKNIYCEKLTNLNINLDNNQN